MSQTQPLLIELGTDELPVKALPELAHAFFDGVLAALDRRGIAVERGDAKPLYTPRRLAVLLPGVATEQPEQRSEVPGPYLNIALDADGQPTRALQGFAAKAGVEWTALERTTDAKGERFVHRSVKPGATTAALLGDVIAEAIDAMPIPKPMRWGDHEHAFARPVHWLVVLLGEEVVEAKVMDVASDRHSRGHRFMHPAAVRIDAPGDYAEAMRAAKVLVDSDERRGRIVEQAQVAASAAGGSARIDPGLLEEVNGLVEWPAAVACSFDEAFLKVPAEALVATMEANQKFFPVLDPEGRLTRHFVGIANIESRDVEEVRKGYERVIRPRFADAQFFFEEDLREGLAAMNEGLASVTYQASLGSMADKVARVRALAERIASQVGVDAALARRAAGLSKADLQSRMVGEFPELQGIAGRHYASSAGEPAELAAALDEAWMPRFAADAIAPSPLGRVLAIAERLDTLAGGFAAGLRPTGNKDPFALRRNALGLARTLIEGGIDLPLDALLGAAAEGVGDVLLGKKTGRADVAELREFIFDRLRGYYAERGITPQQFEAVHAIAATGAAPAATPGAGGGTGTGGLSLPDIDRRLHAVAGFAGRPEAEALAAANKRSRNILRKAEEEVPGQVDPALLAEDAERALAAAVDAAIADTDPLLAAGDYVAVLARLARLRPQVDAFFDAVMVNAEDPALRRNRLALLRRLSDRLGSVAAIEHLSA
ncbi:glycine--tRNA ligase subunit beta [Lysobacter sp. GX 14042]|uniref:glycine--tRNA ligase subunit beta n=1 Tax=Lysobacter sp. GX 14042 TaxID=2907155 RepID=UPI001F23F681|nr:glycine--tRNA ligase subunit beta [Lysobacter sp. GX 14042]MCE7032400.1 glycine--tRNA ligase subunit beta [Lysobacter sp. GX 14042]